MGIMNNIIIVAISKDKGVRYLVDGFLVSKGFRDFLKHDLFHPMMVVVEDKGKAADVIKDIRKKSPKSKIIVVVAEPRMGKIDNLKADAVEHVGTDSDVMVFLGLERILRAEKESSRGTKPRAAIKVPGKK
jgi:hypothetical protein